ncbi:hypothetical protein [Bradyrhizobium sp. LA7.1]|uniref:hypothetical protein n=1 Tax=Bradyrhizobium sp. LA7.1 TaxID=3156324 RepID=UPI003392CDC3
MTRFYPRGFTGSEDTILTIAKIRDPDRWQFEDMNPDEREVWTGLGKTLNAEFIYNHLGVLTLKANKDQRAAMTHRLCDYGDALNELRKSLYSGELVAHFCDESGKMWNILKDGWGGDEGPGILLRGVVDLEGGIWRRVVLLKTDEIETFARSLPSAWAHKSEPREVPGTIVVAKNSDVESAPAEKRKGGPGRRAKADWEVVDLALREEIKTRGFPDKDNEDPHWRRQADVEDWVRELLKQRREPIKESRRREKVAELLKAIKAGN